MPVMGEQAQVCKVHVGSILDLLAALGEVFSIFLFLFSDRNAADRMIQTLLLYRANVKSLLHTDFTTI